MEGHLNNFLWLGLGRGCPFPWGTGLLLGALATRWHLEIHGMGRAPEPEGPPEIPSLIISRQ